MGGKGVGVRLHHLPPQSAWRLESLSQGGVSDQRPSAPPPGRIQNALGWAGSLDSQDAICRSDPSSRYAPLDAETPRPTNAADAEDRAASKQAAKP